MTYSSPTPAVPFPIYQISSSIERYMLYDVNVITWLRRTYHILGVLIGTLPQTPSQNVFLGLPLELQPEEARLLVEKRLAFVIDDLDRHKADLGARAPDTLREVKARVQTERLEIAKNIQQDKKKRNEKASKRNRSRTSGRIGITDEHGQCPVGEYAETQADEEQDTLFEGKEQQHISRQDSSPSESQLWSMTPSASTYMLSQQKPEPSFILPKADPSAYVLFRYLQLQGYFMTPGLRFGCRFSVYPGDPLRFHSHFLAISADWDEELELLHLVGGGRLGTGVKKGWMIGGLEQPSSAELSEPETRDAGNGQRLSKVRIFCIEWGGM